MFRNIAFVVLFAIAGIVHAETVASPVSDLTLPDMDKADPAMKKALEQKRQLTVQLPGLSHHFSKPTYKDGTPVVGRKYNERNWGIGAQLEDQLEGDWEGWVRKTSFGVMKDSLDAYGLYAGVTWQKRVVDNDTFSADIGGGAFLFYRTLQFDGKRLLVPAVLPVLSALHKETRIGANIVLIPQFRTSNGQMPGVVFLQFTKEF